MSKNMRLFFTNFAFFSICFLVLFFNSFLMPSTFDMKERNISGFKSILGLETNKISEVLPINKNDLVRLQLCECMSQNAGFD